MLIRFLILALIVMTTSTFAQTPPIETGISHELAKWRAANYSDVRYKLNLTLEKMSPVLKGTIEISLQNKAEQIILDWRKIRGMEDFSKISNVSLNGKTAKFEETDEHLVFKDGVIKGENVIKLDFTSPIAKSGAAITRYVDKEDGAEYIYSLFVPSDASTAFPVFDQPDLKARFWLDIVVPKDWGVISNTDMALSSFHPEYAEDSREVVLLDHTPPIFVPLGMRLHRFFETKPISTYLFSFAVGDFEEFTEGNNESRPIPKSMDYHSDDPKWYMDYITNHSRNYSKIYVRKSQAEKFKQHAAEVFRLNREGVKFLEDWFDYKFPFPKYDLVLIPEFPFGGMEHAGATFLREDRVIFPTEPTKNDYITRANVIFHEAAHQWFGDTVTMKWFDDLWLKEGFAEFMAYKTLAKVMPEYNAWKIFYERNKQAAYLTDVTRGTTPIYQEIPNLSSAKSAYGNIVYRKAPSFLRQAEFYLGEDKFQTAVRAFLKKHEFANAEWTDLVKEFELASKQDLKDWGNDWVTQRGLPIFRGEIYHDAIEVANPKNKNIHGIAFRPKDILGGNNTWSMKVKFLSKYKTGTDTEETVEFDSQDAKTESNYGNGISFKNNKDPLFIFPNYQDYGYGIFLLDEKSRAYVLENIGAEKDDFLRSMMWGSLWDSVRFYELAPEDYVKLVIKNINVETDESTIQTLLGRVSTAMNYYLSDSQAKQFAPEIEELLIDKMQNAPTLGQKITFYRAFVSLANSENARTILKRALADSGISVSENSDNKQRHEKIEVAEIYKLFPPLKAKDKFDIVTRLIILGDADALKLLAELEKNYTDDAAKRYAYAARAGIPTAENKLKYWNDFVNNKEISESWIESAFAVWNTTRHAALTLPYLEKALAELPNLKKNRKIFFVNGWLGAVIGGQKSAEALAIVNKFLDENPNLDKDLRLKILENSDNLERAVKIRAKYGN